MAIPNMIAIYALNGEVVVETKAYFAKMVRARKLSPAEE